MQVIYYQHVFLKIYQYRIQENNGCHTLNCEYCIVFINKYELKHILSRELRVKCISIPVFKQIMNKTVED